MGSLCSCTQFIKSRIFYYKSRENPYQYCKSRENPYQVLQVTRESVSVLQVTRESVSGTTSHVRIRIRYYKSRENPYQVLQVTRESVSGHVCVSEHVNEIEISYDKIIIPIVPSYTEKITRLLPLVLLLMLRTRNNTDGNKLVIFSGIALYYGDNYIIPLISCWTFITVACGIN